MPRCTMLNTMEEITVRVLRIIWSLLVVSPVWADGATPKSPPVCSFKVINTYPHDPAAFTQGLLYKDGLLHESTGRYGASSIRKVRLESGEVLQQVKLPNSVFGEGLTAWQDRLINITWTSGVGFIIDARDLEL